MSVTAEWLCTIYLFQYIGCLSYFAYGIFKFATSFVRDLKGELQSLNKMSNVKNSQRDEMYMKLSEFIKFHANSKELSVHNRLESKTKTIE